MKIYGNIVCQNNVGEILRCIESILPILDHLYIIDGGSTDGTQEVLKRFQKAYNFTFDVHPFDTVRQQRNRLLEKTPKNAWIIAIDPDEKLNHFAFLGMKECLANVDKDLYTDDVKKRANPLTLGMPYYRLYPDLAHTDPWRGMINTKVFYYDRNLSFMNDYHTFPSYGNQKEFMTQLNAPEHFAILHYAYLDEQRMENVEKDIKSGKREYTPEEWNLKERKSIAMPLALL